MFLLFIDHTCVVTSVVVAGAASEPADPHLPAVAVPGHVPPRHALPRRPAEDHPADAA